MDREGSVEHGDVLRKGPTNFFTEMLPDKPDLLDVEVRHRELTEMSIDDVVVKELPKKWDRRVEVTDST